MIVRRSAAIAILGMAFWSSVAHAQHGQKPSSGATAPAPPVGREPADRHASQKVTPPAAAPAASGHTSHETVDNLRDAIARIDEAIGGPRADHAPKPKPTRPTAVAVPERLRVKWRIELTWPTELLDIPQSANDRRVVLTWR